MTNNNKVCHGIFVSPEWIDDKSSDEKAYAKHHKQAITYPLVFGIVGQLGCLRG